MRKLSIGASFCLLVLLSGCLNRLAVKGELEAEGHPPDDLEELLELKEVETGLEYF